MSNREEIHSFASQFLDVAMEYANICQVDRLALGDSSFDLYTNGKNLVSSRLKSAFFSSEAEKANDTLVIWENLEKFKLPVAKWSSSFHYPLGQVNERLSTPFRVAIDRHTGTISVYDKERRIGAVWRSNLAGLPYWSIATPFRVILSWFADQEGGEFVHSAAISRGDSALLISGPSGSGKSTLSLFAALNGYDLISDDYLVVKENLAYAVYTRGKVHENASFYNLVRSGVVAESSNFGEKRIINLLESPIRVSRSSQIRGIVLPIVTGLTAYARISSSEAFRLVAPYSISGLLGGNSNSLRRISSLTRNVPATRFALAHAPSENLKALEEIFEQVS